MFLNLFLFYQVVRPLGRKSVNKYLYLYLYKETERPRDRQTDRQRAVIMRQRDQETDRQRVVTLAVLADKDCGQIPERTHHIRTPSRSPSSKYADILRSQELPLTTEHM